MYDVSGLNPLSREVRLVERMIIERTILSFQIYSSIIKRSINLTSLDNGFKPETSYITKLCS